MSETDLESEIPWGALGRAWWLQVGAECRASEKQIKLAACRHAGMTRTRAAVLAGYASDGDRARKSGSDAAKSTAVTTMLTLASAAARGEAAPGPKGIVTKEELEQKLSDLVRGHDPHLALRASVEMTKLYEQRPGEWSPPPAGESDGYDDFRVARSFLRSPLGAAAYALLMTGEGFSLHQVPMVLDVAESTKRDVPALWDWLLSRQSAVGRQLLAKEMVSDRQREIRRAMWSEIGVSVDDPAAVPGAEEGEGQAMPSTGAEDHAHRGT